jgi:hypothetical protein
MLDLLAAACRSERSREMELIASSVRLEEPGGGHMLDSVRAILQGPGTRNDVAAVSSEKLPTDITNNGARLRSECVNAGDVDCEPWATS